MATAKKKEPTKKAAPAKKAPSKAASKPKKSSTSDLKALLGVLAELNKEAKAPIYKTASDELLSDVKHWFKTGCPTLDLACGGGFPSGRVTEIFGKKGSGKSTIVQHALAQCQRDGGIAIYIDTEKAAHRDRMKWFGIDEESLVHLEPNFLEDAFEQLFKLVRSLREKPELADRKILVVWDTIVYTSSRLEVAEKGEEKKGYTEGEIKVEGMVKTQRAKTLRAYMSHLLDLIAQKNVAFVFVNHITEMIGAMYPGQYAKPGGTATDFAASLQVLVKANNSIKMLNENEEQVGNGVIFRIEKTRLSVPKREVGARLNWFKGIDVPMTVLDYLKARGLVTKEGARFIIPAIGDSLVITSGPSGEKKFCEAWVASPELQQHLLNLMQADYDAVIPWKQPEVEEVPEGPIADTNDVDDPTPAVEPAFSIFT